MLNNYPQGRKCAKNTTLVPVMASTSNSSCKCFPKVIFTAIKQNPQENLSPHSPLLILFTTSAQTHIFPEIRIDAVRFLDLFLELIPEALVSSWTEGSGHGNRILEGYLGILNAGTKYNDADGQPFRCFPHKSLY